MTGVQTCALPISPRGLHEQANGHGYAKPDFGVAVPLETLASDGPDDGGSYDTCCQLLSTPLSGLTATDVVQRFDSEASAVDRHRELRARLDEIVDADQRQAFARRHHGPAPLRLATQNRLRKTPRTF